MRATHDDGADNCQPQRWVDWADLALGGEFATEKDSDSYHREPATGIYERQDARKQATNLLLPTLARLTGLSSALALVVGNLGACHGGDEGVFRAR